MIALLSEHFWAIWWLIIFLALILEEIIVRTAIGTDDEISLLVS